MSKDKHETNKKFNFKSCSRKAGGEEHNCSQHGAHIKIFRDKDLNSHRTTIKSFIVLRLRVWKRRKNLQFESSEIKESLIKFELNSSRN